jgi:hypothetical protein
MRHHKAFAAALAAVPSAASAPQIVGIRDARALRADSVSERFDHVRHLRFTRVR